MDWQNLQNNTPQIKPSFWVVNRHLKILLLVLIVVFLFSGVALAAMPLMQQQYRQKIYDETVAGLPKHQPKQIVLVDGRLQVDTPKDSGTVGRSFTVSGYAQHWFEGNISLKVLDSSNKILFRGNAIAGDNYDQPAQFQTQVELSAAPSTPTGQIEFDDYSAKDGKLTYQKNVIIRFKGQDIKWTTFDDEKYGFEVMYPSDWVTYDNIYFKSEQGAYYVYNWGIEPPVRPENYQRSPLFSFGIIANPKGLSLQDFFAKEKNQPCEECSYLPYADIKKSSTITTLSGEADIFKLPGVVTTRHAYIAKGYYIYEFVKDEDEDSTGYGGLYSEDDLVGIFNKMVSTFKITK